MAHDPAIVAGSDHRRPATDPATHATAPNLGDDMERTRSNEPVASFDPARLRDLRRSHGMSHDTLGSLTGLQRPNLIAYERGDRRPGVDVLVALAKALGVDPLALTRVDPTTATLADLRARAGLTRVETAARLGISSSYLRALERDPRQLRPELAKRLARMLRIPVEEVQAAHARGVDRTEAQSNRGSPVTVARRAALAHRLPVEVATRPATAAGVTTRAAAFAGAAGVHLDRVTTSRREYRAQTGIDVAADTIGEASWHHGRHVVFIDPDGCRDTGTAETLIAHEIGHLRWPSYGHKVMFFTRVQELLDHPSLTTEIAALGKDTRGAHHESGDPEVRP